MILYALDTNIRTKIIAWIGIVAASTSVFASIVVSKFPDSLPPLITAPSTIAIFGVFYYLFDNYLWKWKLFINIHGIPDINGEWEGVINRSDVITEETENDIPIIITVSQTWSKIDLILENNDDECCTGRTRSFARSATFNIQNPTVKLLRYIWEYEKAHGFSELRLRDDNGVKSLEGPYHSSANKKGYIQVEKK